MSIENIIVYTQESCIHCHNQLKWMKSHNITFEERDISNENFTKELINLNGRGTPLTLVKYSNNQKTIINGFDPSKLSSLLYAEKRHE